ncbi:hypothetical protein ABIF90_007285 [Bradyrhizobium japonicum]
MLAHEALKHCRGRPPRIVGEDLIVRGEHGASAVSTESRCPRTRTGSKSDGSDIAGELSRFRKLLKGRCLDRAIRVYVRVHPYF